MSQLNEINYKVMFYTILIFSISLIVRFHRIERGSYVVWDEAHFGKFASKYLNRTFYFDVHPPLGKMLTALSGYLFGQDKDFLFKSGNKYPEHMDYVGMRKFHATLGAIIPVIVNFIMKEFEFDQEFSFLFSMLFVFENGFISISRLILLDSHMLLFTALSTLFITKHFNSYIKGRRICLYNLFFLGLSIGCAMSVKWIGCLTTLYVGLFIIYELWNTLLYQKRLVVFIRKFTERALFLIVLPILLYILLFVLHFKIVNHSGPDDGYMSSLFQYHLKNSKIKNVKRYVGYGHIISLKCANLGGGYLHSHDHTYPQSESNQITSYFYSDHNNDWAFQKVISGEQGDLEVMDNDDVVLYHLKTKRYLSISDKVAIYKKGMLVEALSGSPSRKSVFRVKIVLDKIKKEPRVKSLTTQFRLYNMEFGCYISSTGNKYKDWGFSQGEIACIQEESDINLWNIHKNPILNEEEHTRYNELDSYHQMFLFHLIELNKSMYITNKSFVQDPRLKPARIVSRPSEWFFLRRGLRMNTWDNKRYKFYMFGNPITWYISSFSVIFSPLILIVRIIFNLRNQRKISILNLEILIVLLSVGGWMLHYLPFFMVGRVLYFHHYFPALFFSMLSVSYPLRFLSKKVLFILTALSFWSFYHFSPLTFGFGLLSDTSEIVQIKNWDFRD